jgi:predicted TIM-barrel fold metal-dependent hydrolase
VKSYPHAEASSFTTTRYEFSAETLLTEMQAAGVTSALLVQSFGVYGTDNRYALDSARTHPDRFRAVCGVAGGEDILASDSLSGIRLTTLGSGLRLTDGPALATCRAAGERGLPVSILLSRRHIPDVAVLAGATPGATIVLDHFGLTQPVDDLAPVAELLASLADLPNVYLKLTTPVLTSGGGVDRTIARFGAGRLMWGSNYPMSDHGGYSATVALAKDAFARLPDAVARAITVTTAAGIWPGLDAPSAQFQ